MLPIFYLLLMLRVGRCTDDSIFETKTVGVGDDVTLNCTRQTSEHRATLYWIRLVSGNFPEFLGGTFTFDYPNDNKTAHITAEQGPGTFLLHISKSQRSDTGIYYCIKVKDLNMTFIKGAFLRVKGSEPAVTAVIQVPPSAPVRPGDSVTLQCSVLFESENTACPGGHSVYWFRVGADESHTGLIYAHGNSGEECEKSPEAQTPQKCVYSFSKNISSSDAGTYYCAVATCGEILFGNGTKLDTEDVNMQDLQMINTVLFVFCAALSLIVITLLIYTIKKKSCGCCSAADVRETNNATASGDQQSQQREENLLVYSAPTFNKRNAGKAERRNVKTAKGETIYSDVAVQR